MRKGVIVLLLVFIISKVYSQKSYWIADNVENQGLLLDHQHGKIVLFSGETIQKPIECTFALENSTLIVENYPMLNSNVDLEGKFSIDTIILNKTVYIKMHLDELAGDELYLLVNESHNFFPRVKALFISKLGDVNQVSQFNYDNKGIWKGKTDPFNYRVIFNLLHECLKDTIIDKSKERTKFDLLIKKNDSLYIYSININKYSQLAYQLVNYLSYSENIEMIDNQFYPIDKISVSLSDTSYTQSDPSYLFYIWCSVQNKKGKCKINNRVVGLDIQFNPYFTSKTGSYLKVDSNFFDIEGEKFCIPLNLLTRQIPW